MELNTYVKLIIVLSILGVLDTIYLSYHYIKKTAPSCPILSREWCGKVMFSSYNKTLGIPNAFAGLLAYVALILFACLFINHLIPFYFIAALVVIGFGFSLYFLYLQSVVIRAFCFWCVISAINFILLFLAIYFIHR
jgi:uncharacterized membrane protein